MRAHGLILDIMTAIYFDILHIQIVRRAGSELFNYYSK